MGNLFILTHEHSGISPLKKEPSWNLPLKNLFLLERPLDDPKMVRKGSLFPKIFILPEILPGYCRKEFSVDPGQFLFPFSELFVLPRHHRRLIPECCREGLLPERLD